MKSQFRLKETFALSMVLALNSFLLSSCNSKNTLETFSFDAVRKDSLNEEYRTPLIEMFSNKDELNTFFESNGFEKRSDFDADVERFESEFGFEFFNVIYFGQLLNTAWRVEVCINENNADKIELDFAYEKPDSNTYLPGDNYYQKFYLLEKNIIEKSDKEMIFKIGNDTIYYDTSRLE